jgi:hypothetical protein
MVIVLVILFFLQLGYSIFNDYSYRALLKRNILCIDTKKDPTFNEFYSPALFQDIIQYIGKPVDSYKVGALGFHPAVLLYNGFYTIDGYVANYELKYKHLFGKLIQEELNKNKEIENYFYSWGSRCYIFDDQIGKFNIQSDIAETESLDLNYEILKSMNCQYIISCVKIENLGEHLILQSIFENKMWTIYLYNVK